MADLYSNGTLQTAGSFIRREGKWIDRPIPLTRSPSERVNSLTVGPHTYATTLDGEGFVTALTISQSPGAEVAFWPDRVAVAEDRSAPVFLQLRSAPSEEITLTVSHASGDDDLRLSASSSVTFTPMDWRVPKQLWLRAASDADAINGVADFTISSPAVAGLQFTATEVDANSRSILENVLWALPGPSQSPTVTYVRDTFVPQLSYSIQSSPDLIRWTTESMAADNLLTEDARHQTTLLRPNTPSPSTPTQYYRLRVSW